MLDDAEQRDVGLTQKQNRFLGLVEKTYLRSRSGAAGYVFFHLWTEKE